MNARAPITTVEDTLAASHTLLTVREIMRETGHAEEVVRAELKRLAGLGQIEHIPGRGRYDGRYGLLRPIAKASPADGGADSEGGETDVRPISAPQYDPDSVAFDPVKRADALERRANKAEDDCIGLLRIISDIREAIGDPHGKIMLGDLASHIKSLRDMGIAHQAACLTWESSMMDVVGEDGVASVVGAVERLRSSLAAETIAREALQEQLDAMRGATLLSGQDRYTPAGYIMTASKRKPRRITKPEAAREAAVSAIRAGAQRAEVFALVPVGRAVRAAEWREVKS